MTGYDFAEPPCPDCDAPPGQFCHWWCPRYNDDDYDQAHQDQQAGGLDDGF